MGPSEPSFIKWPNIFCKLFPFVQTLRLSFCPRAFFRPMTHFQGLPRQKDVVLLLAGISDKKH